MKIVLHSLSLKAEVFSNVQELFNHLTQHQFEIFATVQFDQQLKIAGNSSFNYRVLERPEDMAAMDFMISIGGDGTLLDSVCLVGALEIPILGLNTGRLGFLATVASEKIAEAIHNLATENYQIESRSLISLQSSKKLFNGLNFGLNEFTIHKRDTSSMITVHTYIDGKYLNSYWADGLIVATPTGSTGYSLSCGGPLISPEAKNLVITPVSPHNLNVRPIIVSDESEISFEIEGRAEKFLISLDSRSTSISSEVNLSVRKENFSAKLVKLPHYHFFDTLRQKLNWGFDMRN
ncbi:NAD kinase [Algoriphagus halophytocola]|uniref:NAD kinase n=1 Tax=Algoriphagus halophytocola TaxID=2991499 RepID=A0ABY6MG04_9BACT|nr:MULTISPECIES: NAD kinase [unclassified Algoriphagus]UZD21899.1 NAD kinase [Algoriphagus sp. TR-M5]WBL43149.1 NAD kinase [Algoriphagus sp. TR-M9]